MLHEFDHQVWISTQKSDIDPKLPQSLTLPTPPRSMSTYGHSYLYRGNFFLLVHISPGMRGSTLYYPWFIQIQGGPTPFIANVHTCRAINIRDPVLHL